MSSPPGEVDDVVTGKHVHPSSELLFLSNSTSVVHPAVLCYACVQTDVVKLVDDSAAVGDDTINAILRVPLELHCCYYSLASTNRRSMFCCLVRTTTPNN
jgi:hypothetical protein